MVLRDIVNSSLLAHSLGKKVSIIGEVISVDPSGRHFQLQDNNNEPVTIKLSTALDSMLEGYVEVRGTCQSKNTINADEYIQFSQQQSVNFNQDEYNDLCTFLQTFSDIYATS